MWVNGIAIKDKVNQTDQNHGNMIFLYHKLIYIVFEQIFTGNMFSFYQNSYTKIDIIWTI